MLTEVLRSYRDTDFAFEVVKYLFDLLEKPSDYPYRLLHCYGPSLEMMKVAMHAVCRPIF